MSDYFKAVTDIGFAALVTALGGTPEESDGPCRTLRHLAAVYDQHPDYDSAWRT